MKRTRQASLLIVALLAISGGAQANDDLAGLQTPNGKLVHDFLDLWFNQHQPQEAFDRYVSRDNYVDHAVYSGSTKTKQTFESEKGFESKMPSDPKLQFIFKQVICEGDLVVSHIQIVNGHSKFGDEMVEIERVKDGKIVDHWDIHEALKEDSMVFVNLDH